VSRAEPLEAITLDFGNTLVPVRHADLRRVVEETGRRICEHYGPFPLETFLAVWSEERERQFAEEVPEFREVDLNQRVIRVLARLRGAPAPPRDARWDDVAAATYSDAAEIAWSVDVYSRAFVEIIPAPEPVGPLLERLSARYRLAVLSNWPLALTIDRFVEAAGWSRWLQAVVVSQRVGTIKPHPEIFRVAAEVLRVVPAAVLHVGDDWAADVVGAKEAGWRVAYLQTQEGSSPLPASRPDERVRPDLELESLADLEGALTAAGW
jgi:HAD superfamily hydrolase (TIGR01509 family)